MKATEAARMVPADHNGRNLLAGRVVQPIPKGAWLILLKAGDAYVLHAASDEPNDPRATVTLASFLSPEQIDELERREALEATTPTVNTKRNRNF